MFEDFGEPPAGVRDLTTVLGGQVQHVAGPAIFGGDDGLRNVDFVLGQCGEHPVQ